MTQTVNLYQSFKDYCKVFKPNDSFEDQLKGWIKRYPSMNEYRGLITRWYNEETTGHRPQAPQEIPINDFTTWGTQPREGKRK